VVLIGAVLPLAVAGQGPASGAPYPASQVITSMVWDFSSVAVMRKALGSDLWPITWAADDNLYAAWGDGGGFDGNDERLGRVSLGFARISGIPIAGVPGSYYGKNVWGRAPAYAESPANYGGKVDGLIAIDGVLYAEGSLWTAANCHCPDPTLRSDDNPQQPLFMWSADLGKTWRIAPWNSRVGAALQFGRDYSGAADPEYVYLYYQHDVDSDPTRIYLRRVLKSQLPNNPATQGHYQYLSFVGADGTAHWSEDPAKAVPVFVDSRIPAGVYANPSVVHDAAIGRYLLAASHGGLTGQVGFFDAPSPWGPWTTIAYYDDWGGLNESAGASNGVWLPAKWILDEGRTLWAVFSGVATPLGNFDSFNVVEATLTVSDTIPKIISPRPEAVFTPGQRVTARGTGRDLSWTVRRSGAAERELARAAGPEVSFTVPRNSHADQSIRITLRTAGLGGVFRDHPIRTMEGNGLVLYWNFDEDPATGTTGDLSRSGSDARLVNHPTRVPGPFARTLRSSGSAWIEANGAGPLANLYAKGMSVAAWVEPSSAGCAGGAIADKGEWFLRLTGGGGLRFAENRYGARDSERTITPDTWQHVAATWDGSDNSRNIHLYINGVPSDGPAISGLPTARPDSFAPLIAGRAGLGGGFCGAIDGLRIYDRVLNASQIHTLASGGVNVAIESASGGRSYRLGTAQPGAALHTDTRIAITKLPAELSGAVLIQTSSRGTHLGAASRLGLSVDETVTVYVAFAAQAGRLPSWLGDGTWVATPDTLEAGDPFEPEHVSVRTLYRKVFRPGALMLGGDASTRRPGGYPDYSVFIVPRHPERRSLGVPGPSAGDPNR
jgi:Concanavalin A-like lectin/glucanases superfamily